VRCLPCHRYAQRQYFAPSELNNRRKPPPSESLRGLFCALAVYIRQRYVGISRLAPIRYQQICDRMLANNMRTSANVPASEYRCRIVKTVASENSNGCPRTVAVSGPIKCESPNSLICRSSPKIRESIKQRILSRFSPKPKIRESIGQTHTILSSACHVAR
jgi:hypothetical protein